MSEKRRRKKRIILGKWYKTLSKPMMLGKGLVPFAIMAYIIRKFKKFRP